MMYSNMNESSTNKPLAAPEKNIFWMCLCLFFSASIIGLIVTSFRSGKPSLFFCSLISHFLNALIAARSSLAFRAISMSCLASVLLFSLLSLY